MNERCSDPVLSLPTCCKHVCVNAERNALTELESRCVKNVDEAPSDAADFRAATSARPLRADAAALVGIDASGMNTDSASFTKLERASGKSADDGSDARVDDAREANAGCSSVVIVDAFSAGGAIAEP